jgi:hypothetical protein
VVLIHSVVPISHFHIILKFWELYLKLGGIIPPEDNFHLEGTIMRGGNLNLEPTINLMEKMCPPHLICGISLFQEIHSSCGDTILNLHNNLLMDKHQIHLTILKTHLAILHLHMFLKTPQILCTLVNTNLTREGPLVTIIRITQCMVLLVSLCHTSITHRLTNNYLF